MPFGLKNAPALFQRMMNHILQEYLDDLVAVYLDDIIIYSKIFEEHIKHITKVLEKLREANLIIKLRKCKFFEVEISFLEHIVRRYELKPVWIQNLTLTMDAVTAAPQEARDSSQEAQDPPQK